MKEKTEFYATAGLSRGQIRRLLHKEFPGYQIPPKTISNAMQAAKKDEDNLSDASLLVSHLQQRKIEDPMWFISLELDKTGQLSRLFWMAPIQRKLYLRYHDVLLADTTANTNRFKMALCNFVIVDTENRSRLVANALMCQEGTDDYTWVLKHLLNANDGIAPSVLLIDEDTAMEAACVTSLPDTAILNCIWHLASINLKKNLQRQLKDTWTEFNTNFWKVRNAITPEEFEVSWAKLQYTYGDNEGRVDHYLKRLYSRRQRWAWPWVGSLFTAGMQSTQRVEKTHNTIKGLVNGRTTKLIDLFSAIDQKIIDEAYTTTSISYKMAIGVDKSHSNLVTTIFYDVDALNFKFLGSFALYGMRKEMITSLMYQARLHEKEELLQETEDLNEQKPNEEKVILKNNK